MMCTSHSAQRQALYQTRWLGRAITTTFGNISCAEAPRKALTTAYAERNLYGKTSILNLKLK